MNSTVIKNLKVVLDNGLVFNVEVAATGVYNAGKEKWDIEHIEFNLPNELDELTVNEMEEFTIKLDKKIFKHNWKFVSEGEQT